MAFIKNLIMKKYILNTQIAKFEIQSEPHGEWDLWINKMPTLTFESVSYTHLTLPTTPYV